MLQQRPAAPNSRVHGSSATPTVTRRLAGTCAAFQQQQRPSATPTTPTALAALAAACAPSLAGAWRSGRGASATARPATSHSAAASAFAPATATKAPAGAVAATSSLSGLVALRRGAMSRHSAAAAAGAGSSGGSSSGGDGSSSSAFVEVPADGRVVLVGITGATGRSALQGLLTAAGPGRTGHQLWAMTRNPSGASAQGLPAGVQALAGDLDAPASLGPALRGASAVYCHALSKDGATADPQELVRARSLAAAAAAAGVKLIMYNSSGGRGCGYGITQMEQKHQVEDILAAAVPTVALQATLFMEELWKRYTRPGILKGAFTWSSPGGRPIQLVAARDLGLAAGTLLAAGGVEVPPAAAAAGGAPALRLRSIELAGDELSPEQMCATFAKVQGSPVRHNRAPAWPFWFLARDVWRISKFLTERGYQADVAACRQQFPGMLTLEEFLIRTGWADPSRTFEDGIAFAAASPTTAAAPAAQPASAKEQ